MADSMRVETRLRAPRGIRSSHVIKSIVLYLLMIMLGITFAFPLYWAVATSLKPMSDLYLFPPEWVPSRLQLSNYAEMLNEVPFGLWTSNTVYITAFGTLGTVVSCCLVGYAFARFEFPGREALFLITLVTMMFPAQITLIPTFVLFHKLGWINTFKPLIVPSFFGGGAFYIFLMRQFIRSLPRELDEAAEIDGANPLGVLLRVLLPLCKPALATVAVITFISHWNSFIGPLIYLQDRRKYTIAVGLNYFRADVASGAAPLDHLMMAAVTLGTIPSIVLFFLAQNYFVRGVVMSGLKG